MASGKADPRQEYLQSGFVHGGEPLEVANTRKSIETLPATLREVVVLRDFLALSSDEIGGILSIPPAVVESRAEEARALLERRMPSGTEDQP